MLYYDSRPPDPELTAPFELEGAPENAACLLLHGFGCSPYTMRELGATLSEYGHHVYAPLLPGHGEPLEDFNDVRYTDWLEATEASFAYLKSRYQTVAVIGFSMGGTLALNLSQHHTPSALAVLAAPVFLDDWVNRIYPLARNFTSALPVVFDVANRAARKRRKRAVHKVLPVKAVGELLKLLDTTRSGLSKITAPILVAQSRSDHTVPPSNAPFICHEVSSSFRRLIWLKRAFHVLPVDYGHKRLALQVVRFLRETQK